jgi:hypothetical protein
MKHLRKLGWIGCTKCIGIQQHSCSLTAVTT